MQYFSNFSNSLPVSGSSEQNQTPTILSINSRSRLSDAADLGVVSSQRVAISKAYGDILLNGGHLSC